VFGGCAWLVMVIVSGRGLNEREERVWAGRSKMRRAATLNDRVVHGALEEHLVSLYIAGDFLSLLVLESSGMKGCLRRQGRVQGVWFVLKRSETRASAPGLESQGLRTAQTVSRVPLQFG
jgi:hypothetical protein